MTLTFPFAERGSADISPCGLYRYTLTRHLTGSGEPLVFVMLNPSSADANDDDPTLRRCIGFGRAFGRCRIHVVNLFAYRTPYTKELKRAHASGVDVVGPRNGQALDALAGTVVCAWGPPAWPFVRERAHAVAAQLTSRGVPLLCLGRSKDGSPRHPLMLPGASPLEPWSLPS